MTEIYDAWKPIRNFLKHTDPKTGLETLRYYSLYGGTLDDSPPPTPPSYIEVPQAILERPVIGILPWDMEVLARELILSATEDSREHRYDLRKWRYFGNLMEKLRYLDNAIGRTGISSENVLLEMFRIGHRQFPHQTSIISVDTVVRYGKLFTHSQVKPIVLDRMGLPYEKTVTIGIKFWSIFENFSTIFHPTQGFAGTNITQQEIEQFLHLYSKKFGEMKALISAEHSVDNTFLYQYSPLMAYPLIEFEENGQRTYVCSSVNRFSSQITRGVYYMLYSDSRFDNAFGTAFEDYVGEILNAFIESSNGYDVYSQEVDIARGKRRCDWIIDQGDSFVMVECKTKRMAIGGYTVLDDDTVLIDQLGKIADAVIQTYQGYLVYKGEGYSPAVYPYGDSKQASICVVTLEKWYLYGTPLEKLKEIVKDKLEEANIDPELINEVPYEVIGVDDFEKLAYLASRGVIIRDMFAAHSNGEEETHEFSVFMNNNYREDLQAYSYPLTEDLDLYLTPGEVTEE